MHPTHEMMEMLASGRDLQALIKLVHQPGLASPDRPPQVNARHVRVACMQRFVAFLQRPHGMFLGLVLDEALLFDRLLPGI
ncbi:hypothetical protein D3C73_786690 [compost metagenome]